MRNIKFYSLLLVVIAFLSCKAKHTDTKKLSYPYNVFVSIVPQKYFVEKIGGDKVKVFTMVKPGFSPATYEPLPKQMVMLSKSRAFFRIRVPFEKAWIKKIRSSYPNLVIVDTTTGVKRRTLDTFKHLVDEHHKEHKEHKEHKHDSGAKDPHIWLSPELVKIQAKNIAAALIKIDPKNSDYYKKRLKDFTSELDNLQAKMTKVLSKVKSKKLLVFHPAYGYLADEFGFKQIPIEIEGKKPGAKQLVAIIKYAKQHNIKTIFIQKQFSTREAEVVAKEIKGNVIKVNPLAYNYMENLFSIAKKIAKNMETK